MCCCMGSISSCYILLAYRFRRDFADVEWVSSPIVHWGLSTRGVLTLEYLPGIKISDVTALRGAGIDTKLVARRATEAYLIQLLQTSFLHSDPHPGNIGIDRTGDWHPAHHGNASASSKTLENMAASIMLSCLSLEDAPSLHPSGHTFCINACLQPCIRASHAIDETAWCACRRPTIL